MHKSILKKKDLYKAQNAYNASRYRGEKVEEERERLGGQLGLGGGRKEEEGSKVKEVNVLQCPPLPPPTPGVTSLL